MNGRIFLIGVFFGIAETAYFGWNMFPASDAEVICDGIAMLITSIALVVPNASK
jgi:hypothetical protein